MKKKKMTSEMHVAPLIFSDVIGVVLVVAHAVVKPGC